MYLKIRSAENNSWIYIDGFVRLEAKDESVLHYKMTEEERSSLRYPVETLSSIVVRKALSQLSPESNVNVRVLLDDDILSKDCETKNQIRFRILTCVVRDENGRESDQSVLINTEAYLCSDRGHTMDRFIVNRYRDGSCQRSS